MINRRRRLLLFPALTTVALWSAPSLLLAQGEAEEQPAQIEEATTTTEERANDEALDDATTTPQAEAPAGETSEELAPTTPGEELADEPVTPPDTARPPVNPPVTEEIEPTPDPPTQPVIEEPAFEPVETEELTTDTSSAMDFSDLSDDDFIPLENIEEEDIDPIFPAQVYPYIDWSGQFRLRHRGATRYDLGTGGTSSILPPTESYTPTGNPANPDAVRLWGADMRLRLEPTLSITEGVRIHIEADLLGNMVLGALPVNGLPPNPIRPDPSRNQAASNQFSAREREWYQNALQINEAYGELSGFFGSVRAGRMDNHWGTGMFYNGGDCDDCNWGDSIDRVMVQSQFLGIYGAVAADWPNEGITSVHPSSPLGQPYDRTQIDDVDQYTFSLLYAPQTELEIERQQSRIKTLHKPVFNAGALFSLRNQDGTFADPFADPDLSVTDNALIYRGMNMYIGDVWAQFLYNPKGDTMIRVELEAMAIIGSIDNATFDPVGRSTDEDMTVDVNCFEETERANNAAQCGVNSKEFQQVGVTLESEFTVSDMISFGVNAGMATGGNAPNWGLSPESQLAGDDLNFFRFDPDYQVDLILFRNVIGTVTNAYYANPYLEATFLERGDRKLRLDLDGIVSRAFDVDGTPAGNNPWLGLELDGALRFFLKDAFHASVEGGLLLPFEGLAAQSGRPRLTQFGANSPEFNQNVSPSTAWTVQFRGVWNF